MRLDLRMASAGSRQEALVPPGGAPAPPECVAANHARGRRTGHVRELPAHAQESGAANLHRALPFVPLSRRLMRAPSADEVNGDIVLGRNIVKSGMQPLIEGAVAAS